MRISLSAAKSETKPIVHAIVPTIVHAIVQAIAWQLMLFKLANKV